MKWWRMTIGLACVAMGLGGLAYRTAYCRVIPVRFKVRGVEAERWAEKAKHEWWTDLVVEEVVDQNVTWEPVPRDEIDKYLQANTNAWVRCRLRVDEYASVLSQLAEKLPGDSDAAKKASNLHTDVAQQLSRMRWFAVVSVVAGFFAAVCGVTAATRKKPFQVA